MFRLFLVLVLISEISKNYKTSQAHTNKQDLKMILNAPPPAQFMSSASAATNNPNAANFQQQQQQMAQLQAAQQMMAVDPIILQQYNIATGQNLRSNDNKKALSEDASEILVLVLNGGPKWGFRIKQLNDNRVIVSRVDRGPAERAGLRVYDELLSVNNVQLSNSPRSLLLHDHPEQFGGLAVAVASHDAGSNRGEQTPLLAPAGTEEQAPASADLYGSSGAARTSHGVELSKLDFTYQLIRHSSASNNNKLVLGVRRFLDAAYARASALAASNTLTAWNFSSSGPHYRPSISNQPQQDTQLDSSQMTRPAIDYQRPAGSGVNAASSRRPTHSIGTNVYKCCDCYCDNAGKLS